MLKSIFSLDYEIHGNGDGCPYELMVEPTERMMALFDEYGAKLTIMADVAEVLRFRDYAESGRDDYHYAKVADQLRKAVATGHDVQLHIHASYFKARHEGGRWKQDWSEYCFSELPYGRMEEMIRICREYLETLLRPVKPDYRCVAFRAANWAVSPSRNVVRALLQNGIRIDTSVFKYGSRSGIVNFDYANAESALVPWPVDENDICRRNPTGNLYEFPIYCENRWIGAFLTRNRIYRALQSRHHRIANDFKRSESSEPNDSAAPAKKVPRKARLPGLLSVLANKHAWKADFNQCGGRQLIRALLRAEAAHRGHAEPLPFVLIGHSKLFTRFNETTLRPFLSFVARHPDRFGFGTFGEFSLPAPGFEESVRA